MASADSAFHIGITAGSAFDLGIEREVFEGLDGTLDPVDVRSTDDLKEKLATADAVIDRVNTAPYTTAVMEQLDSCRVIARCGIGVDNLDLEAAAANGIYIVNVPSYCEEEVSDHTITLLLALERNLIGYTADLTGGRWEKHVGSLPIHRLSTRTLGLVGFGSIARRVSAKAQVFGMNVIAADPYVTVEEMRSEGVEKRPFDEVIETADIVSVHAPLTQKTRDMFGTDVFERMGSGASLINVARGGLVDEDALVEAIRNDEINGAALDVYRDEPADRYDGPPPTFESPLCDLENVILTPHVAWYSVEASDEKRRIAARDVRRILEGENPENAVNNPNV